MDTSELYGGMDTGLDEGAGCQSVWFPTGVRCCAPHQKIRKVWMHFRHLKLPTAEVPSNQTAV